MSIEKFEGILGYPRNFIEEALEEDIKAGKVPSDIYTRFPPEPNGFLHIGHSKAICINFGIARKYRGKTNLRFDDTNPTTEETRYVEAIKRDVKWLGFDWEGEERYASDYFQELYDFAVKLIKKGLAYVDDSTPEEIAEQKGVPTEPGTASPYRERTLEENLALFAGMKNGEFPDGSKVLRAKVDMSSPNMHMRDPVLYRIKREAHHRTGDDWIIYPMYDFTHGQSDSIEEITHSLCSLEFRHHRPLYNWFIEHLEIYPSRQIEFARMNVEYMITSKRKLMKLVDQGLVEGWDDPRMSTLSGLRRRGYPPGAIREFCDKVGVAKRDNLVELSLLESCVRESLNHTSKRVMVVLDPIKVTITNYDKEGELLPLDNNPEEEQSGSRDVSFSKHIFIERDDFMIDPPRKYFRMGLDRNVRLKGAYILHCHDVVKDDQGEVVEVLCTYYPDSKSGSDTSGVKAKGTLHWVDQATAVDVEARLYDTLFTDPKPDGHEDKDFLDFYNPASLELVKAKAEASLTQAKEGDQFQFMRKGYFVADKSATADLPVFNRTVSLKDRWKKMQQKK